MALLDDILAWTETLPMWQRDATRRLFLNQEDLSAQDIDQLYLYFKNENKLNDDKYLIAEPLTKDHLPASTQQGSKVSLEQLKNLQNVNKLLPDQTLNFSAIGLTVVYGGNGTGKSGYARVMKRACRARDQVEEILPDATDANATNNIPTATFVVSTDGDSEELQWSQGSPSPDRLAQFSVFDSACARAYLTKEQDIAYLPYGLDVVERLATQVVPAVQKKWQTEIDAIDTQTGIFDHLRGTTQVGEAIANLSEKTDEDALKKLGVITPQDSDRLSEIELVLNQKNPLEMARIHKLRAERLKSLAARLNEPIGWVTAKAVTKLQSLQQAKADAENEQAQVFEALSGNESLLEGTGGSVWKTLFESARSYAASVESQASYPTKTVDDPCVLCQQPLNQDAVDRLNRFDQFIKNNTALKADKAREDLTLAINKIGNANFQVVLDKATIEELSQADPTRPHEGSEFQNSIQHKREWMLNAVEKLDWSTPPELVEGPMARLRFMASVDLRLSRTLVRSADEKQRSLLELEKQELDAKKALANAIDSLIELVQRIKRKAALNKCKQDFNTRIISAKSKQLTSQAVTTGLSGAINKEFGKLGVGHIETKLKEVTKKGVSHHQLILDMPVKHKLDKILSEGEQRAIAIAAFMAELSLANHSCGIIIDDPVSSLSHNQRKRVAKRLVQEAGHRQVLVFTHEIVFLKQLEEQCEKLDIDFNASFLQHYAGKAGQVNGGLPWKHKSVNDRLDDLNKKQREFARRPWSINPSEQEEAEITQQYSLFRSTIERFVQDIMLGGAVQRFRDYVDVEKIKRIVGTTQAEVDEVERLRKVCNDATEAHDQSSAKDEPAPTPDDLKHDLDAFQILFDSIKQRRKDAGIK